MGEHSDPFEGLKNRTKRFALLILSAIQEVRKTTESDILKKQIIRSATSVGANYRSACRAKSRADFVAKIKICLEEADETQYWLELFFALHLIEEKKYRELFAETDELVSIFVASAKTAGQSR